MKKVEGGVTAAEGFQAASTAAGIKYKDRTDMAMIYSTEPCAVAGTFTTNVVKAAPVKWDKDIVKNSAFAQAVVVYRNRRIRILQRYRKENFRVNGYSGGCSSCGIHRSDWKTASD